jgi:hypothetical protein
LPLRLSELHNDRRSINVRFDAGDLKVTYQPSAWNDKTEIEAAKVSDDDGGNIRAEATRLARIVIDWDLEGDDGQKTPVSVETLASLGLPFMNKISTAIMDDAFPNRNRGRR